MFDYSVSASFGPPFLGKNAGPNVTGRPVVVDDVAPIDDDVAAAAVAADGGESELLRKLVPTMESSLLASAGR